MLELDLGYNQLGSEGGKAIANSLKVKWHQPHYHKNNHTNHYHYHYQHLNFHQIHKQSTQHTDTQTYTSSHTKKEH